MSRMNEFSADDAAFMARALQLAERGLWTTHPNPRVGCVLVRDGAVVGEGWHERAGGPHAEVMALRMAGEGARGSTAYVTLEPCCHHGRTPPCSEALVAAGITRVVAAMEDPNPLVAGKGLATLRDAGLAASSGLMGTAAEALNRGFCQRMRSGRPFLFSKLAMSLDGRTALASGESRWITGAAARQEVHRLRAASSAVLTGIGTALADDPALTVRLPGIEVERQPARVLVDSSLRLPTTAQMLLQPGQTVLIAAESADAARADALRAAGAEVLLLPADASCRVDFAHLPTALGRLGYNEVMVEAGPTLNGALLKAGLVDEWIVYLAPLVLGDEGRGLFHLPGIERMTDRIDLRLIESRQVGQDLRLRFGRVG